MATFFRSLSLWIHSPPLPGAPHRTAPFLLSSRSSHQAIRSWRSLPPRARAPAATTAAASGSGDHDPVDPSESNDPNDPNDPKDPKDPDAVPRTLPNFMLVANSPGNKDCVQCDGDGYITCPVCEGAGMYSVQLMDVVSSSMCRMCSGKRRIPCPTCKVVLYDAVIWWDLIPDPEDDPDENWRTGEDGTPRIRWNNPPV